MSTITRDVEQAREALRGLMQGGVDPLVVQCGVGFIGEGCKGFTLNPVVADRYETEEQARSVLPAGYTFRVVPLRLALAYRLLTLHNAMGFFDDRIH